MSTKNSPEDKGLRTFLLVSLLIHAGLIWSVFAFGPRLLWLSAIPYGRDPVIVEVVELPPGYGAQGNRAPDKDALRHADRTSAVDSETFPRPGKGKSYSPAKPSGPSAFRRPGTGGTARGIKTGGGAEPRENPAALSTSPSLKGEVHAAGQPLTGVAADTRAPKDGSPARPNLFLTEEKITELAKKYEEQTPEGEKGKTLRLNTSELKYQRYLIGLKNRVELYWDYPALAVRNGWEGKLNVEFTVKSDGSIGSLRLARSSSHPVLDDAAMTALKLAAPFPPFPEDFDIKEINIHGQFEYNIIFEPVAR